MTSESLFGGVVRRGDNNTMEEEIRPAAPDVTNTPHNADVLWNEKGQNMDGQPGSAQFRLMIHAAADDFQRADSRGQQRVAARIVQTIEYQGGRFRRREWRGQTQWWREISKKTVLGATFGALRYVVDKRQKKQQQQQQQQQQQHYDANRPSFEYHRPTMTTQQQQQQQQNAPINSGASALDPLPFEQPQQQQPQQQQYAGATQTGGGIYGRQQEILQQMTIKDQINRRVRENCRQTMAPPTFDRRTSAQGEKRKIIETTRALDFSSVNHHRHKRASYSMERQQQQQLLPPPSTLNKLLPPPSTLKNNPPPAVTTAAATTTTTTTTTNHSSTQSTLSDDDRLRKIMSTIFAQVRQESLLRKQKQKQQMAYQTQDFAARASLPATATTTTAPATGSPPTAAAPPARDQSTLATNSQTATATTELRQNMLAASQGANKTEKKTTPAQPEIISILDDDDDDEGDAKLPARDENQTQATTQPKTNMVAPTQQHHPEQQQLAANSTALEQQQPNNGHPPAAESRHGETAPTNSVAPPQPRQEPEQQPQQQGLLRNSTTAQASAHDITAAHNSIPNKAAEPHGSQQGDATAQNPNPEKGPSVVPQPPEPVAPAQNARPDTNRPPLVVKIRNNKDSSNSSVASGTAITAGEEASTLQNQVMVQTIAQWLSETAIGHGAGAEEMELYAKEMVDLGLHSVDLIQEHVTKEDVESFKWMKRFHKRAFLRRAGLKG